MRYATIFGGVGEGPQIQALRRGVDIAVATPGRLLDLMQQRHVNFADLQVLVLDEADRMLDMGFLPPIRKIVAATPKVRQTLLFSATLSKEIEAVSKEFLKTPVLVEIGARSTPVEAVAQWIVEVSQAAKVPALVHLLKDAALESVLVFSRTKHGADRIARKLEDAGVRCATLHSNRTQGQRILALKRFKSGDVRCLVATDIAARGIDVDGISHVINYDFPPQPEDYVHRIGRTGRAQAIGDAISFVSHDEMDDLRRLERFLGRGITRRKLEGFVANTPHPPFAPPGRPNRAASRARAPGIGRQAAAAHTRGPAAIGPEAVAGRGGRADLAAAAADPRDAADAPSRPRHRIPALPPCGSCMAGPQSRAGTAIVCHWRVKCLPQSRRQENMSHCDRSSHSASFGCTCRDRVGLRRRIVGSRPPGGGSRRPSRSKSSA